MRINIFLCLFTLALCDTLYADYQLGYKFYQQGNFEQAYEEFLTAASYGDKDAQYNLGVMSLKGEHLEKSIINSYAWFSLAAQNPVYNEKGIHTKIFSKLSEHDKQKAEERKISLFSKFSDEAIFDNLSPKLNTSRLSSRKYRPRIIIRPKFPENLDRTDRDGWVDIIFTIEKDGSTRDHLVFFATHQKFEESALNAVRQWQFDPTIINSKPTITTGIRHRIIFSYSSKGYDEKIITRELSRMKRAAEGGSIDEQFGYAYFLSAFAHHANQNFINDNYTKWYEKAARNGHSSAAYFLGLSLLRGEMCEADTYKSAGWLTRAASQNIVEAQYTLAIELLSGSHFEKNESKGLYWLERAAANYIPAKLRYAWILSSHTNQSIRDPLKAQSLIETIPDDYHDKQALYEVRASVAAALGDFKSAINWQEKALDDAQKLGLPTSASEEKLNHYREGTTWQDTI